MTHRWLRGLLSIILLPLLLIGCAKQELIQQYYDAANKPLLDITLPAPNGQEYKLVVRRQSIPQYQDPVVASIKEVVKLAGSPLGILGGAALVLDKAGGNVGGDYHAGDGNFKTNETTEMIIPEVEGE